DTAVFRPLPRDETRAALGLPRSFLFVCAGRLSHEKGTHHALRALVLAREQAPDACLLVVGDGAERARLERLASDLGLAGGVGFGGAPAPGERTGSLSAA